MATMSDPQDHLPGPFSDAQITSLLISLGSSQPTSIRSLTSSGAFHTIYTIAYKASDLLAWFNAKSVLKDHNCHELILRISGNHILELKTENEVAILSWLSMNTSIPVPRVVAFDSTCDNVLDREFILLTRESGECLADVFHTLDDKQRDYILDQLIDVLVELHKHSFNHIGGLCFSDQDHIIPGPVLEETFWHVADISQYWPEGESFSTLNISGPSDSYVAYITAHIKRYIHTISIHSSLQFMQDTLPLLEIFLNKISEPVMTEILNNVKLRLAHKDLHFGNILVDASNARITSILDWEFSGVVPYPRWNPAKAFLWNAQDSPKSLEEKRALVSKFEDRANQRGAGYLLEDAKFTSVEQEKMQAVQNYLRAIVEVCPRGVMLDRVHEWKQNMLEAMAIFGIQR